MARQLTKRKVDTFLREFESFLETESGNKELNETLLNKMEAMLYDAISDRLEIQKKKKEKPKLNLRDKNTFIVKTNKKKEGPLVLTKKDAQKMDDFKKGNRSKRKKSSKKK